MVASVGLSSAVLPNALGFQGNRSETSGVSEGRAPVQNSAGLRSTLPSSSIPSQNLQASGSSAQNASSSGARAANGEELSQEEERAVQQLKQRDAEVRAHEQAHAAAGGTYASAPSYEYTVGPDGKRYATSGEVQIDTAPVRDNPEATIRKMDVVIRAALAPAEPSSQDLQVARQAQQTRAKAQSELAEQRLQELRGSEAGQSNAVSPSQADAAYQDALGLQQAQNTNDAAQQLFSIIS